MKKMIFGSVCIAIVAFVAGTVFFGASVKRSAARIAEYEAEAKKIYEAIPVWHRKIQTDQDIKIGIITDTHVHPRRINRQDERDEAPRELSDKYMQPLNKFVAEMGTFQPEFVVHLGDVIEGTDDEDFVGIMGLQLVKKELDKVGVPVHWVIGNHDLRSVTRAQFMETLGLDAVDYTFDVGDYRFVVLDGNYNPQNLPRTPDGNQYISGKVPPQTLDWLKKQLETDKRVFVFIHQGTFLDASQGDRGRSKQSLENAKELREILTEYRVDGIFNGHMEARRYEKAQFTNHYSFTGTKKSKTYPQSYYALTITDGTPDVTFFYEARDHSGIRSVDFESCADSIECGDYVAPKKDDDKKASKKKK